VSDFVKLSEVAKINPRPPKDIDEAQVVTFLPMAAVSEDGYVSYEEQRIYSEVKKGFTYFERGDFIIAKITPCFENGKAALTCNIERPIGFGSTEFHVVSPIPHKLDKNYLYHLLWSDQFRFYGEKEMRGAAGQKRISTDFLREYKIPLPPLEEQKRIAAILDKADAIRRKRQQAIDLTDQLLRSVFLDMFGDPVANPKGWEKLPLEKIVDKVIDCPHSTPQWTDSGKVAIRTSNLTVGSWNWDDTRYVCEKEFHDRSKRAYVKSGDIVLSREGTVGIAAIIEEGMEICLGQRLVQLVPNLDIANSEYILHILLYELEPDRIERVMVGATSKHINVKELRAMKIPVPPLQVQNKFKRIINKIDALKRLAINNSKKNGDLFNSLTQRAFRGELKKQAKAA